MIISDYNMPKGNGSFVFEYAKSNLKKTPFMLVTSDAWTDHKAFHNYEGVGYVSKPFIDDVLIKEAERLLKTCQVDINLDHKYVGISLPTLANIRTVSHPLFVKLSDEKYIKILNSESVVSDEELMRFRQKGISFLFVERTHFPAFIRVFKEKVLHQMLFKGGTLKAYESLELSAVVHEVVLGAMKNFGLSKETEELAMRNIDMVRQMSEKFSELNSIFQWADYSEQEYSFSHSVLICFLAAEVVRNIKFVSPFSSEILSLAAYFHDVSLESHQIRNEARFLKAIHMQSKINKDDLMAVKSHSIDSSEKLKQWLVCPQELYTVIREHHERPDGTGLPDGKLNIQIHELSACFIVCEDLVQSYLELKDRNIVFKYFEAQRGVYSLEPFKRVHEFLLNKLSVQPSSVAS
jgi:response regulator RpfG family c-di-GMP phosphodiesterase